MTVLLTDPDVYAPWLAPYIFGLMVLAILAYLFKIFRNWYSLKYHRPLYRDIWVSKNLKENQIDFLQKQFPFYTQLSDFNQKRFRHRVATFISRKDFIGKEDFEITDDVRLLIAANAIMLSFGRKNYLYKLVDSILVFPESFQSELWNDFQTHEFNPKRKAIVFSWKEVHEKLTENPKRNLILFEFMHAMQLEAKVHHSIDSQRLEMNYQNILKLLIHPEFKERLEKTLLKRRIHK